MPAPHHSVFLQAGCPSCRPTNSVKALKAATYSSNRTVSVWDKLLTEPLEFSSSDAVCAFIDGRHTHQTLFVLLTVSAMSQAETQKWFDSLKQEVEKRDADIRQLQRSLKESEGLLVSNSVGCVLHLMLLQPFTHTRTHAPGT